MPAIFGVDVPDIPEEDRALEVVVLVKVMSPREDGDGFVIRHHEVWSEQLNIMEALGMGVSFVDSMKYMAMNPHAFDEYDE